MEIYGKYNLPILLERHPKYYKELGGTWTKSFKGLIVFNSFFAIIIKFLNHFLPYNIFTKYLVIYSVVRGYRNG